jgi:hypothetical protein
MMMRAFRNPAVARIFAAYPPGVRRRMLTLRAKIFAVARSIDGVGEIEETLKWGEPAYVTAESKSGSTIRIDWKPSKPDRYAMYFICTTDLVETFRTLYPHEFTYEGNRAITFALDQAITWDSLAFCIGAALTWQRERKSQGRDARAASTGSKRPGTARNARRRRAR